MRHTFTHIWVIFTRFYCNTSMLYSYIILNQSQISQIIKVNCTILLQSYYAVRVHLHAIFLKILKYQSISINALIIIYSSTHKWVVIVVIVIPLTRMAQIDSHTRLGLVSLATVQNWGAPKLQEYGAATGVVSTRIIL